MAGYHPIVDTQRLRYFLAVADEGSINHAASILGIAQPALSRQIRLLEKDVGTALFRRTARGVELTDAGRQLRTTVAAPLRQLELSMIYVGSSFVRAGRGLRIGLPVTAVRLLPLPVLDRLSAECPLPGVHVVIANNEELTARMREGTVDVAVMEPPLETGVHYESLLTEELVVIGGADSVLDPGLPVRFAELADHSLVCLSSETGILDSLEQTARRLKTRLVSRYTTDSLELTRDLIESGHGYSVLPLSACAAEIREEKLRYAPLRDPSLTRQLGIAVTSQNQLRHGITAKVSQVIRDQAAILALSGAWSARISLLSPDDSRTN